MTHLFYHAGYPSGNHSLWNEMADQFCPCIETTHPVQDKVHEDCGRHFVGCINFDAQLLICSMASECTCTSVQQYWAGFVP